MTKQALKKNLASSGTLPQISVSLLATGSRDGPLTMSSWIDQSAATKKRPLKEMRLAKVQMSREEKEMRLAKVQMSRE